MLDKWFDQAPTTYTVDVDLSSGNHTLVYAYYEGAGGTTAKLSWGPVAANRLTAGQNLPVGQQLYSPNGQYFLLYQSDGHLVLYTLTWQPVWWSGTAGTSVGQAIMQSDGNFVIYDGSAVSVFETGTSGNPGAYLAVEDDGRIRVYSSGGVQLWVAW